MLSKNDQIMSDLLRDLGAELFDSHDKVVKLALKKGETPAYAEFLAAEHERLRMVKLSLGEAWA